MRRKLLKTVNHDRGKPPRKKDLDALQFGIVGGIGAVSVSQKQAYKFYHSVNQTIDENRDHSINRYPNNDSILSSVTQKNNNHSESLYQSNLESIMNPNMADGTRKPEHVSDQFNFPPSNNNSISERPMISIVQNNYNVSTLGPSTIKTNHTSLIGDQTQLDVLKNPIPKLPHHGFKSGLRSMTPANDATNGRRADPHYLQNQLEQLNKLTHNIQGYHPIIGKAKNQFKFS